MNGVVFLDIFIYLLIFDNICYRVLCGFGVHAHKLWVLLKSRGAKLICKHVWKTCQNIR